VNTTVRAKTKDGIMWVSGNIVDLDNNGKRYGIIHSLTYDRFDGKARGSVVEIDPATACRPIGLYDLYEQDKKYLEEASETEGEDALPQENTEENYSEVEAFIPEDNMNNVIYGPPEMFQ